MCWYSFLLFVISAAITVREINAQYGTFPGQRFSDGTSQHVSVDASEVSGAESLPTVIKLKPKTNIEVYYETNCPDSMRFITQQLYPVYREMEDILQIRLIPFGKAKATFNEKTKMYDFACHHGPPECYGNTVQSCAISLYPETEDHLNLINCMESYPRPSSSGEKCARRLSLDWRKISKCADNEEGNRILFENAKSTQSLNPSLNFVPWIVIDKNHSEQQTRLSMRNFKQVVCDHIKGQHKSCRRK